MNAPLPTDPFSENVVAVKTAPPIVNLPLAAVLPVTPLIVTCCPVVSPWAGDVVITMGVANVAPVIKIPGASEIGPPEPNGLV